MSGRLFHSKVLQFRLARAQGNLAACVRKDRILALKLVEGIVGEGSGVSSSLA